MVSITQIAISIIWNEGIGGEEIVENYYSMLFNE
jgi:hypothetical protein